MSLAAWWHRVTVRFFRAWLERMRKDPDVSLDDFRECERAFDKHLKEIDDKERNADR